MSLRVSQAMVMAAGLGTRLRPLTLSRPKPMVQVAGKMLVDYALDMLAAHEVQRTVVNTHYLAEMLESHLKMRATPHILISREEEVLETGGGILKALPLLGDSPFFVMNSDVICVDNAGASSLQQLAQHWQNENMDALLLLHPVEKAIGYDGAGDFFLERNGVLTRRAGQPSAPFVFTGVQLLHPRLLAGAPRGKFSLNLLYDRDLTRIRGLVHQGDWLHVGDAAGLAKAEAYFTARE
jgi:N-acetyl-alpha-D-muramate 1-phosphate uridylyltransferase